MTDAQLFLSNKSYQSLSINNDQWINYWFVLVLSLINFDQVAQARLKSKGYKNLKSEMANIEVQPWKFYEHFLSVYLIQSTKRFDF